MNDSEPRSSVTDSDNTAFAPNSAGLDVLTGQSADTTAKPSFLKKLIGFFSGRGQGGSLRENLQDELAREAGSDALFSAEERRLLGNILRLRELRVDDAMIPRADIEAVEAGTSIGRLMEIFRESGHSRMPVYNETLDDPRGMVHIKDLMTWMAEQSAPKTDEPDHEIVNADHNMREMELGAVDLRTQLKDTGLVRDLLFVPPSMPAMDLMAKMQAGRIQMALVIDEYGGTDGLISLEDLVEEVVGDIEDEHDEDEEDMLQADGEGTWIADPRMLLEDLQAELGAAVLASEASEDVDTLGGLLYVSIGRVPVRGELVGVQDVPGFEFEVLDADPRRIKKLRINRKRQDGRSQEIRRRIKRGDETAFEKNTGKADL